MGERSEVFVRRYLTLVDKEPLKYDYSTKTVPFKLIRADIFDYD